MRAADIIFSPLDTAWALDEGRYSGALKQNMVWRCGLLPYGQAAAVMVRIGKRAVSDSSLWRMVQQAGQQLDKSAARAPLETTPKSSTESAKLLSMDGGMVNIFGEGWKELKVALVGSVVVDDTSDRLPQVHTQALRYSAVLGDVSALTPVLLDLADCTHFGEATRSCLTADGAPWIWNLADAHFPNSLQILDWYHARQHLSGAAQALFSDQPAAATAWFQAHTDDLFEGHLAPLVADLQRADLADTALIFAPTKRACAMLIFKTMAIPLVQAVLKARSNSLNTVSTVPACRGRAQVFRT